MMILALQNRFDQLRTQWSAWWDECFPSAVPLPEVREIPGREVLFVQIEEVRASQARDSAMRQAVIASITKDLSEAQERTWQIQQLLTEKYQDDWLSNLESDTELERLRSLILEKAPTSLALFIEELDDELIKLRRMETTTIPSGVDRDYLRMKKTVRFQTNGGSITRRVKALQLARERAIAMQMEPLTVHEIANELYRLRQSLPAIVDEQARGSLAAAVLSN